MPTEQSKKLYKNKRINTVTVPRLQELSVLNILDIVKDDSELLKYLPDEYTNGKRKPDRDYLYNCINTLHPGFLD